MYQLLRELTPHALWAAIGASGLYASRRLHQWWRTRGHAALLDGLEGNTLFVFPPRHEVDSSVLPRMAIEDFLAINNIISAFMRVNRNRRRPEKVRDTDSLTEDR